jgi:hypothetical protein
MSEEETAQDSGYEWPEDPSDGEQYEQPGPIRLTILYVSPFLVLLLFPPLAWIALLPMAASMRWTVYPPHRRRLIWIYSILGLISAAPLILTLLT